MATHLSKNAVVMLWIGLLAASATAEAAVKVVATQETYASIAREIGGDRIVAEAIVEGAADVHFVKPKPSYAVMLQDADLFISTGLDLELWAPVLVNKSGNRAIADGGAGYVAAAHGVELMEKPTSLDRSAGDVHIFGNPHIQTSPVNMSVVAANIATGLCKVDPQGCAVYRANLAAFQDRLARRLYGDVLVELLGTATLDPLARSGRLVSFLEERGRLADLGGWLAEGLPFRGRPVICYHRDWTYFASLFGLIVVDYVEPKPGIPPTARHVAELIERIEREDIGVLVSANYFERSKPQLIADRTGIAPVVVPMSVGGEPGVETYFDLVDLWIARLREAFARVDGEGGLTVAQLRGADGR
ncbi:MAG: metal ABC transporter substrate-binding protein [Thermoanaerobaculales bacterium]|jgi:ABC-type Zn uptake system ZnuABC Zn-binding protein ZnuA|nr:metal ABC transporter substrate-binding protein [Thermoanaerobaculales bacterium]